MTSADDCCGACNAPNNAASAVPDVLPTVAEHYTADCRWNIGEGSKLPYIVCADYNNEIGGESPSYGCE